jgi:ABC-type phosphate transport system substrate-binding protein
MKNILSVAGIIILSFGLILPFSDIVSAQNIQVIVNKNVADSGLSKDDIQKIFTGDKTKWNNNETIVLGVLADGDIHEKFLKDFVGRSSSQFKTTWKQLMFTGKGKVPKKCESIPEMVEFVSKNGNAIGYVTDGAAGGGDIKIVQVQ